MIFPLFSSLADILITLLQCKPLRLERPLSTTAGRARWSWSLRPRANTTRRHASLTDSRTSISPTSNRACYSGHRTEAGRAPHGSWAGTARKLDGHRTEAGRVDGRQCHRCSQRGGDAGSKRYHHSPGHCGPDRARLNAGQTEEDQEVGQGYRGDASTAPDRGRAAQGAAAVHVAAAAQCHNWLWHQPLPRGCTT